VTFKVENLAMRVGHRWDTTIGYVVDRDGRSYENNDAARRLLLEGDGGVARRSFDTPAGCTDSTVLVFDIPDDAHEPCLQVRGELLMGDLFDGDQFEKTKVRLF
jgi:hypothetical protein